MNKRLNYLQILFYTFLLSFPFTANGQIDTGFTEAIKSCDVQAVRLNLSTNMRINAADSNGANALMWAVYYCDVPVVKELIQHGAKVADTGVIYVDVQNEEYYASLQGIAAGAGKVELLQYLVDSLGLPLDAKEYNPYTRKKDSWTPLCWAVNNGNIEVINYLLDKGADINVVIDMDGATPLILAAAYAATYKDWNPFNLLMERGGKQKLGDKADNIIRSAAELSKQKWGAGDWDKELIAQQIILKLREIYLGRSHIEYAISLNQIAYLYHLMGQYDKALPLYEQAETITKNNTEPRFYASIIHSIAYLYEEMGLDEKALFFFQQATAIARKTLGEEHPDYATSLQSLASFYRDMGQYEKALPLMEQAASIRKRALSINHPNYALSLHELASLYHQMGQYKKALPLYEQAMSIRKKAFGEDHPFYAKSLYSLALFYHQTRQYEKALPLYKQAMTIQKKALGEEHPEYVQSLNSLAVLYEDMNQYDEAISLFTAASALALKHITRIYTMLSEQEKMSLLNKKAFQFSYLPSLLYKQNIHETTLLQQLYTNELSLKGMVLEDQEKILNAMRKNKDSSSLQLYKSWYSNKVFLGTQLLLPVQQRNADMDSLEEATNQLEQQLSRTNATFFSQQQRQELTSKDIAQKLRKGEAAIEFINFRIYNKGWTDSIQYAALIMTPDSAVNLVPLFEEKQLQGLLRISPEATAYATIEHLYGKNTEKGVSDSLYELIWKPLEKYLEGVQKVYYATVGLLHYIAFQALPVYSAGLLLDKYQLNQLLSTRSLATQSEAITKPKSAQIWGDITYSASYNAGKYKTASAKISTRSFNTIDTNLSSFNLYTWDTRQTRGTGKKWKSLPYTKQEMDTLNTVFVRAGITPVNFTGSSATEEAFKGISENSPQVLHVATHGFFLPLKENKLKDNNVTGSDVFTVQQNPMFRSGLVLAGGNYTWFGGSAIPGKEDGILTAYEIAQMDLTGTDLVVLSACETGLGDVKGREGVIGLQRALKMAGVKQMIISLWQVPDKATMELMALFYKNWLDGQSTWEALRKAQLQLKEKYKHPYFWAGFVLVE